ncbi:MAG: hypothetical protein IJF02_00610 [Oscillospiraceae bacterium]|nr:hypothetical protein [Oscillospiraceae bacterium]
MCRRSYLCGCALIAFGFGLLVGSCFESGFLSFSIGSAIIALGLWCMGKK